MASADASSWLKSLKKAKKTALVQDGRKKIHYLFEDGREMAEDYDLRSNELLARKWKVKARLGGAGRWEYEVGEPSFSETAAFRGSDLLTESVSNPIVCRRDTGKAFQWRIRNLPYPKDVYSVTVDTSERCLVVRTTNKKYYKRLPIPDLDRAGLSLSEDRVSFSHANNTLIISYSKPDALLVIEKAVQKELQSMKASSDGDVDCHQS